MFTKHIRIFMLLFVALHAVNCAKTLSWYYRGTAQSNNTVLTFNKDDTFVVTCTFTTDVSYSDSICFSVTKGSNSPTITPTIVSSTGVMSFTYSSGTLLYSDIYGIASGYEYIGFNVYGVSTYSSKLFLNMGFGLLTQADAGTYHCNTFMYSVSGSSAAGYTLTTSTKNTSGGLTLVVNTKSGQAHSSTIKSSKILTYSTLILGASKIFV